MPCEKISSPNLSSLWINKATPSLNPLPASMIPPEQFHQDYYLCDNAQEFPLAAKTSPKASFSLPMGPALGKSSLLFAPVSTLQKLPPPPDSPLARLLYDVTTQLKDFELTTNLSLPMEGIGPGTVQTFTKAVLGNKGALIELGIDFRPFAGPQSLLGPMDQVPIIAPFFMVRILRVEIDPTSRKLQAKVKYLWFPISKVVHADYLKKADLPPSLVKGPGYDLNQGLPVYSWQILDLLLKIIEAKGAEVAKNVGVDQVKPVLEKSEIRIEGNFSNQKITVQGLELEFAPLAPSEKHRLIVTGSLLNPVVTVYGLKAAQISAGAERLRLVNEEQKLEPLEIRIKIDPLGLQATRYEVARYQSKKLQLETVSSSGSKDKMTLTMEEGIDLQGLQFSVTPEGPKLEIQKLGVKQLALETKGLKLRSTPGDQALFEGIQTRMVRGKPEFVAKLSGKGSGDLTVMDGGAELGFLKFQSLQGAGSIRFGTDPSGQDLLDVSGQLKTEIPELRFLVKSDKLKASVQTKITGTEVKGVGRLRIWPDSLRALLEGEAGKNSVTVRGTGGLVSFHQDASEVEGWGEIKKQLGGDLAKKVVTDFFIQPQEISFDVAKMDLGRIIPPGGEPSLEILESELGPIRITGDVWGKLFARLPGGLYFPLAIPEDAKMKGAKIQIARLQDKTDGTGKRDIAFQEIILEGEESKATLTKKDEKRCGFDRQRIHAGLGLFEFSPEDRELQISKIDSSFQIYLKNQILGGCLKIE